MDRYSVRRIQVALALPFTFSALPALAGDTLIMNGQTASTEVRTIGGSAYVKLADVAKALGMVLIKRPDGKYEISRAGGTNQVEGVAQGKIGSVLFDGKWRFQVQSVQTPADYTMKVPSVEPSSTRRTHCFSTGLRMLCAPSQAISWLWFPAA